MPSESFECFMHRFLSLNIEGGWNCQIWLAQQPASDNACVLIVEVTAPGKRYCED